MTPSDHFPPAPILFLSNDKETSRRGRARTMRNAQRSGLNRASMKTAKSAANSAANASQVHNPGNFRACAAVVTTAPVNWESIRQHRRR